MKPIDTHNYINTYLQKEANTVCQVFDTAGHRLAFTESPELPHYQKPTLQKGKVGWLNFFLQLKP